MYEYDEAGRVLEVTELNEDKELYSIREYSYNDYGDLHEQVSEYFGEGDLDIIMDILVNEGPYNTKYEYAYGTNENWVKRIDYENDEPDRIIIREIEYH